ncbi:hypothetical protein CB1_000435024 [Camelus ferus]|nr:hypothetical protein CB1_000435024 [Camelus ferus]
MAAEGRGKVCSAPSSYSPKARVSTEISISVEYAAEFQERETGNHIESHPAGHRWATKSTSSKPGTAAFSDGKSRQASSIVFSAGAEDHACDPDVHKRMQQAHEMSH